MQPFLQSLRVAGFVTASLANVVCSCFALFFVCLCSGECILVIITVIIGTEFLCNPEICLLSNSKVLGGGGGRQKNIYG